MGRQRTNDKTEGEVTTSAENHGQIQNNGFPIGPQNTMRCKKYAGTSKQDNATRRVKGMINMNGELIVSKTCDTCQRSWREPRIVMFRDWLGRRVIRLSPWKMWRMCFGVLGGASTGQLGFSAKGRGSA